MVSASLYETALFWMGMPDRQYLASGKEVPKRIGTENGSLAPYKAFEARDGWVVICAGNDNLFARLARSARSSRMGRRSGVPQQCRPREQSRAHQCADRRYREDSAAAIIGIEVLDAAGVPCAPMLDLDEVLAHPQSHAVGMLQDAPDGGVPLMGIPLRFDGERPPFRASAPRARRSDGRGAWRRAREGGGMKRGARFEGR